MKEYSRSVVGLKTVGSSLGFLILATFSLPASCAEPFAVNTSPRIAAMGGAYVALADDASAVWANPAGLAGLPNTSTSLLSVSDFSLTFSPEGNIDNDSNLVTNGQALFIGGRHSTEKYGIGLYYYQPYNLEYTVQQSLETDAFGHIKQSFHMLSMPMAIALKNGRVKLGASLEVVSQYADETSISVKDETGFVTGYALPETKASSYSGSLSTQIKLLDSSLNGMQVLFGANYRFDAHKDAALDIPEASVRELILEKPRSYDLGISLRRELFSDSVFTLSTQFGETIWEDDKSYTQVAIGGEYKYPKRRYWKFANPMQIAFQLGYSTATADIKNKALNWPDVSAVTFGSSVDVGRNINLSFSGEQKSAEPISGKDSTEMFYSFGFTWKLDG